MLRLQVKKNDEAIFHICSNVFHVNVPLKKNKRYTMRSFAQGDATMLRPTVMCAVPLVLDRIYKGVKSNIKKKGEFTTLLMDFCYDYR
jgi:long-subunit acyl-CoA synthetase (AMP-forming)